MSATFYPSRKQNIKMQLFQSRNSTIRKRNVMNTYIHSLVTCIQKILKHEFKYVNRMSILKNLSIDNSSGNKFCQPTLVLQPHTAKCCILKATNKISNNIVLSSVANQNKIKQKVLIY